MPTLSQSIGNGIFAADYRGTKVALFDTEAPRWWVVDVADVRRATSNPEAQRKFVNYLQASAPSGTQRLAEGGQQFYIIYKMTDKCNFKCTYCYDRHFTRPKNSTRRDRAIREYLSDLRHSAPGARVNILFHGGEPLLEFVEVQSLITYCSTIPNLALSYSVQSNASLLDQTKFDFLMRHGVGICLSVDGVDNDANRLRSNSYDPNCYTLVRKKIVAISGLSSANVGLLLTIGAHNISSVVSSIQQAELDGFSSVSFSFMHKIDSDAIPAKSAMIVGMYKLLIDQIVSGHIRQLAVWPLIDLIQVVMYGRGNSICSTSPCGAGRNLITILPSGELSPCDSLFSDDHIFQDYHWYERGRQESPAFRELLQRNTANLAECSTCDVRQFCNGTCPGNAILSKGTVNAVDDAECEVHYSLVRELVWDLTDTDRSEKLLSYARRHLGSRAQPKVESP